LTKERKRNKFLRHLSTLHKAKNCEEGNAFGEWKTVWTWSQGYVISLSNYRKGDRSREEGKGGKTEEEEQLP